MLFPIAVDVPMERRPWMNWILLAMMLAGFVYSSVHPDETAPFILGIENWEPRFQQHSLAIIGHLFLHADLGHLVGNMIFMWVFGNAVCAKLTQFGYLALWLGVGMLTGVIQPYGLGASGAICGVVGAYVVLYPLNDVSVFYWFFRFFDTFSLSGYWVVLAYFGFDVWGMVSGDGPVAYLSHVSGYLIGGAVAVGLLLTRLVSPSDQERTLIDLLRSGRPEKSETPPPTSVKAFFPIPNEPRLHVRLKSGVIKVIPLSEFQRHEAQGKPVNQFEVSEDGVQWMTFGRWRQKFEPSNPSTDGG